MHLQNLERVNPDLKWRIQLLNISLPPLQQPNQGIRKENITRKLNFKVEHSQKISSEIHYIAETVARLPIVRES